MTAGIGQILLQLVVNCSVRRNDKKVSDILLGIEIINGRKVKREFEETAFIDLAGKHGVVPSSADRIYRGAIDKLRKALEDDKWL